MRPKSKPSSPDRSAAATPVPTPSRRSSRLSSGRTPKSNVAVRFVEPFREEEKQASVSSPVTVSLNTGSTAQRGGGGRAKRGAEILDLDDEDILDNSEEDKSGDSDLEAGKDVIELSSGGDDEDSAVAQLDSAHSEGAPSSQRSGKASVASTDPDQPSSQPLYQSTPALGTPIPATTPLLDPNTGNRKRGPRWSLSASEREQSSTGGSTSGAGLQSNPASFPPPSASQMAHRLPLTDPSIPIATHPHLMELLPPASIQSRGVLDTRRSMSHSSFIVHTFGSSKRDLQIYADCQSRWSGQVLWPGRHSQLSERATIQNGNSSNGQRARVRAGLSNADLVGGMGRSGYYSDDQVRAEMKSWSWWNPTGLNAFGARQSQSNLSVAQGVTYLPTKRASQRVILGPADRPRLFDVPAGEAVGMAEAWQDDSTPSTPSSPHDALKTGWILNIGARIQCLGWVPNVSGKRQFLLVSGTESAVERGKHGLFEYTESPAFSPQPGYPASFQIWGFDELTSDSNVNLTSSSSPESQSRSSSSSSGKMDPSSPPTLEAIFCFPWGAARQLVWCPIPRDRSLGCQPEGYVNLGLLAGIWADGKVRVLWIHYCRDPNKPPLFISLDKPAMEITPENTVPSAVAWLSSESIVVGFANGCVGVWNVLNSVLNPVSQHPPRPLFILPVCSTYILAITPLHPHPHLITISSMSGFVHLLDLSSPAAEHVTTPRTRLISRPLAFHPLEQCILTVDENYALRAHPLRRMHNEVFVGRLGGVANDVTTSAVHPAILVAGQDGMVAAMVMGGRLAGLRRGGRVGGVWFVHQWRRERERQPNAATVEGINDLDSRPLSRFVDGFIPEIVSSAVIPSTSTTSTTASSKKRRRPSRIIEDDDDADGDNGADLDVEDGDADADTDEIIMEDSTGLDRIPRTPRTPRTPTTRSRQTPTRSSTSHATTTPTPTPTTTPGVPTTSSAATNSGSFVFNRVGSAVFSTTYEPEAAVTRVAWHPGGWAGQAILEGDDLNAHITADDNRDVDAIMKRLQEIQRQASRFGGWAAAGTGSGLVRVEDLAVD